jgi:hypothetical protein
MPHGWSEIAYNARYKATEEGWVLGNHPDASDEDIDALHQLLVKNKEVFAYDLNDLKGCTMAESIFQPKPASEVVGGSRRQHHSIMEQAVVDEKCSELRDAGMIRRATLEDGVTHVHPVVVAAKKDAEGNWLDKRFCVDLRATNAKCTPSQYLMPVPDELFKTMATSTYFSQFDMRSGFLNHTVPVDQQKYLAFYWRGQIWLYTRMPFGHTGSPQNYQMTMDSAVREA